MPALHWARSEAGCLEVTGHAHCYAAHLASLRRRHDSPARMMVSAACRWVHYLMPIEPISPTTKAKTSIPPNTKVITLSR